MDSLRRRWALGVTPTATGLPNRRVLLGGLLALLVIWILLVATSLNGTSSGAFFPLVFAGTDPALVWGAPNLIRSDEWNVQTVWAIAQFEQGLPAVNGTFPGGMDATIPQDLPRVDWSVVFRPHLWGFLTMDVGHAQAWKWWLPLFAVVGSVYVFTLVHVPTRPVTSMVLAVAFAASPFFQWWFLQTTLWPIAWGSALLAGTVWVLRARRARSLWVWLPLISYLTVVMGMGIYAPFILPVVLVVALTVVGLAISAARDRGWALVLRRVGALVLAGVAAGLILGVWLVTRGEAVSAFLSTAYPGERLEPTGRGADPRSMAALLGSSFTNALKHAGTFLDGNASESATFFLPGIFLAPVVVWLIWRARRDEQPFPWAPVSAFAAALLLLAFIFVPGWDAIAHFLFLDRTTATRARIGLGFASLVVLVMALGAVSRRKRPGWLVTLLGPAAFVLSQVGIAFALSRLAPELLVKSGFWWAVTSVSAFAILAVARGWRLPAALALLVVSVAGSANVNPLYRGVFDLRDTDVSQTIEAIDDENPGPWVGLGGKLTTAMLLESGVQAFNGFQGAPNDVMWEVIDPDQQFEYEWNRLAGISWIAGEGAPVVTNPYADQISVTFDACSAFAQQHVAYVLSDETQPPEDSCLRKIESFDLNQTDLTIWEVVPAS